MYDAICRYAYLPFIDWRKRLPYQSVISEALRNQRLSRDELLSIQLRKLNAILDYASKHSPFYAERLGRLGFPAREFRSVDELRELPFLTKEELFSAGETVATTTPIQRRFSGSTSGSTGVSLRFEYDSLQKAWSEACQWRGRSWFGIERWDRQITLWARPVAKSPLLSPVPKIKYRLRNSRQFNMFRDFDDRHMAEVLDSILEFKPKLIYGYGSSVGRIAAYASRVGFKLPLGQVKLVEFTADHMYEQERILANQAFSCPVNSAYGASEVPGIAQECINGNGHVSVDNVVVEFLRPDGSAAGPDEVAEIVVTTLNNYAMPLIRYRVGDIGSFKEGVCECGVKLPLMVLSIGKAVDIVETSGCSGMSAHLFDYINLSLVRNNIRGIRQFFVRQDSIDGFSLSIVPESGDVPAAVKEFCDLMKQHLGKQISVEVRFVDFIPSSPSGKRRYYKRAF